MYHNLSRGWLIGNSEEKVLQFYTFILNLMGPLTNLEDIFDSHVIFCNKALDPISFGFIHTYITEGWFVTTHVLMVGNLCKFTTNGAKLSNKKIKKSCTHRVLWRSWWASRRWTPPAPPSWASHPLTTPSASRNCPSPGVWKGCCSTFCLDGQDGHAAGFF